MQKISTKFAIIGLASTIATNALAIENEYIPYVGLNYAYNESSARNVHSHQNSVSAIIGSVYNKYFGTEVFYQQSDKDELGAFNLKSTRFSAFGLDAIAYLPLGCEGRIAPLATAGIGNYNFKHKFYNSSSVKDSGWGYRFGAGLSYNIDEKWSVHFIGRYIHTDQIESYDHLSEYTLGFKYVFRK